MKRETKMSTSEPPGDYDEEGRAVEWRDSPHSGTGSAGYVSGEKRGEDRVKRLRDVVAKVTHGRIPAPKRYGPRF